jgi:hypothetical protein
MESTTEPKNCTRCRLWNVHQPRIVEGIRETSTTPGKENLSGKINFLARFLPTICNKYEEKEGLSDGK